MATPELYEVPPPKPQSLHIFRCTTPPDRKAALPEIEGEGESQPSIEAVESPDEEVADWISDAEVIRAERGTVGLGKERSRFCLGFPGLWLTKVTPEETHRVH
ncbi:hypothetical protein QJS04_geneDACA018534 [Acorus gramineus]|uniref:Uncharacterized protein n=1 Tax=Acorus gramineus TaxID=55184 RepID=A0AAV9AYL2_ACOGR|nr:hypothetical protein QJS04_geneDACA018534 [Acorus gramineus]